jgi:hypothetical protein
MFLCVLPRELFLPHLPKGGEVAEIGVWRGDFSEHILRAAQPSCLHLIDPWQEFGEDATARARAENEQTTHEENYQWVQHKFLAETQERRIALHRNSSLVAARQFTPGQLQWVYIDGDHSYAGVLADLNSFAPLVAPEGFILGHDYSNNHFAQGANFGVVPAVAEFLKSGEWQFLALTGEASGTFVLIRQAAAVRAQQFIRDLMISNAFMVEIEDFPHRISLLQKAESFGEAHYFLNAFRAQA